ncbi:gag-protease polyprotein [Cucumis melo var. makuwa]|uniref:Gag-protease polyprotein n=1 Tax=Cucumis melo var. makuwa TaxID=1194695 RepID=A0A5D3CQE8_CUCMM|nr:gag-protease polyprotein [Cucumis melo var. makuwa]
MSLGVGEVTLEFGNFTASAVEANSPLLGWIHLDADLNEILATSQARSFEITRLICSSFGITRLICASFGIMRLLYLSFGITRLICASFGITRLICASDGITRLIDVRVWREADQRGARRMREGHMDASGFLYAFADVHFHEIICISICITLPKLNCEVNYHMRLKESLVVAREMPPRRGTRRDGQAGRGRGAGRVQPEGFDYVDAGAAAAYPASSCSSSSCALGRAGSVIDRDRSTAWWDTTERMLGVDVGQITWKQFKESFYEKFFSASLRDAKRQEFLNLEQGDRTVE